MATDYNPEIADKIAAVAASYVGSRETGGTNEGPLPDACLKFVGLTPGQQWCAAFASWVVYLATGNLNGPRSGSSGALVRDAKAKGSIVTDPRRGDIGAVIDHTSETGYCHTVIVEHNFNGQTVETIEGNKGDAVSRGKRGIAECTWFRPYGSTSF